MSGKTLAEKLNMIDIIKSLGTTYHFEKHIDEMLDKIYNVDPNFDAHEEYNHLYIFPF